MALMAQGRLHVKWFSGQGFLLHFIVLFVVTGCSLATWWQLGRALGGNGLSWAYTVEWPCFAVYAIVLWWKLLHEEVDEARRRRSLRGAATGATPGSEATDTTVPAVLEPASTYDDQGELTLAGRSLVLRAAAEEAKRAARQGGWHP